MVDTERDGSLRQTRFGRYEIVRRLGRGGMGEVFEARHVALEARAAIKVMHPAIAADGATVRHLLREGRATAAIRHPNVVSVFDVGFEHDRPYLVMELLEGEDLERRLERDAPLAVEDAVHLLLPILSAVAAAHDAGIIHRDLKPSNVVLARRLDGIDPVVVDFGISKTVSASGASTTSSRVAGTPQYMAPEQLRGAQVTHLTDQYALGVLLYQCVTGETPFRNDDYYELLHAIMTAEIVDPTDLNPRVPRAFSSVVLRALARDPDARFGSARALGAALLPFAADEDRIRWRRDLVGPSVSGEGFAYSRSERRGGTLGSRAGALVLLAPAALLCAAGVFVAQGRPAMGHSLAAAAAASFSVSPPAADPEPSSPAAPPILAEHTAPLPRPSATPPVVIQRARRPAPAQALGSTQAADDPPPTAGIERGTGNIPILE
jgi:serine/threonine-protein kinase